MKDGKARSVSAISHQLNKLEESTTVLKNSINELAECLVPVMRPGNKSVVEEDKHDIEKPVSPITDNLKEVNGQLARMIDTLNHLRDRMET